MVFGFIPLYVPVLGKKMFITNLILMFSIGMAGLPPRYRDSVRQITPGLPLFLYNYSTHQLHGVFEVIKMFFGLISYTFSPKKKVYEIGTFASVSLASTPTNSKLLILQAASFGGTNIDPSAWEDKKNQGESCFPAQVTNLYALLE